MQKFETTIPLSLYIHLPWCVRKCPYCDFNSHQAPESLPEALYIARLLADLEGYLPLIWGRRLISIFFGGGTPSLFSTDGIAKILEGVHRLLNFGPEIEITLEANPGTLDESRFQGFLDAGVNRLSLGLQSLQDDKLKILGRIHNRDAALRAIDHAQQAGFSNINLDLMHGLPEQNVDDALSDLEEAIAWQTPHLSWYQLTIEPNTYFHHHTPTLPDEKTLWQIQEEGKKLLTANGFECYEVSAYARDKKYSQHNVNYWEFGDYLGIGAGAHSKITDLDQQHIIRFSEVKNPRDYLAPNKPRQNEMRIVQAHDVPFEFMMNALRLTQGVPTELFRERTGLDLQCIALPLKTARDKGLMRDTQSRLAGSELGLRFLNDLVGLFLINPEN